MPYNILKHFATNYNRLKFEIKNDMKKEINELVELSNKFIKLADGNNVEYNGDDIEVWFIEEQPSVTFKDLIEITFWTKNRTATEVNIKDIARLDEIPTIIKECESYLEDVIKRIS